MKTTLSIDNQTVSVSAVLVASGVPFANNKEDNTLHNKFKVTINTEIAKASFSFYDSQHNYEKGIEELNAEGLNNALSCYLSDAISGEMDFEDFCSEFGYDTDSRRAHKIWKACQKSWSKASMIFNDLYKAANDLQEMEENN